MSRIKIASKDQNELAFTKELKSVVSTYFKENNLSMKGGTKLYFKAIIILSAYLVPFALILSLPMSVWTALALCVLMGVAEAGVGMSVIHDGAHGTFSSKGWVNKLAARTMYIMGSNTLNWKVQHNIHHHTYTNVYEHDDDIATKSVIRMSEHAPLRWYHRFQHIYAFPLYSLLTIARFIEDIPDLIQMNKKGITKRQNAKPRFELFKLITTKIAYLFIMFGLPLLLTDFNFWQILIGFAVIHLVGGFILSTVFQLAHIVEGTTQPLPDENNTINKSWFVHQLETTANFGRRNGLFSWYIGGLDYQIEHHLFQNISHIHYPALAPIVQATAEKYGFQYNLNQNVFKALASNYRKMKKLGKGDK